jgi:colanic acid biosynthesis glycosyl transferase WcaI
MRQPKDPLQAVAAWEEVVRHRHDATLVMCGEGPLLEPLRARVRRSPARNNIEVLGRVASLAPHQARASIYLLATRVEGGNTMATLEAMTNGLVPVMNDAGDAFLLEHARAGVVVAPRSPKALGHAVVGLLEDPERLRDMRRRAMEFARTGWTVDDFVDSTEAFYRERLDAVRLEGVPS